MLVILSIIFVILIGYLLFLIKKINKKINIIEKTIVNTIESQVTESKLYLLEKINNKLKENKDLQTSEFQKNNTQSKIYIDKLHQQLISNEFAKLRLDVKKDLEMIVKSVKNVKIF
jgi:hypothetical protein